VTYKFHSRNLRSGGLECWTSNETWYPRDGNGVVIHDQFENLIVPPFPDLANGDTRRSAHAFGRNTLEFLNVEFPISLA
jgi:hypothetical protein